jgi:hypothetical protein
MYREFFIVETLAEGAQLTVALTKKSRSLFLTKKVIKVYQ